MVSRGRVDWRSLRVHDPLDHVSEAMSLRPQERALGGFGRRWRWVGFGIVGWRALFMRDGQRRAQRRIVLSMGCGAVRAQR